VNLISFSFQADQKNGTVYEARLGDDALLDCQVTAVERDLVSWFRIDGEFPVILTVGFKPHSSDGRAILVSFFHIVGVDFFNIFKVRVATI